MAFQRGDIVLSPFPFSNLTAVKTRPAVIMSSAAYHTNERDLILVAITSKILLATGPFDYILRDWQVAGLRTPSALKPVLFTLAPSQVIHTIGALTPADMDQVNRRLRAALGL